ncbi:hypothetical protein HDU98_009418 [Podochytrium sp. JEL0797]|nr:hypothetical protein HDU98_009418 [Podochytrium sp. JEL0797]
MQVLLATLLLSASASAAKQKCVPHYIQVVPTYAAQPVPTAAPIVVITPIAPTPVNVPAVPPPPAPQPDVPDVAVPAPAPQPNADATDATPVAQTTDTVAQATEAVQAAPPQTTEVVPAPAPAPQPDNSVPQTTDATPAAPPPAPVAPAPAPVPQAPAPAPAPQPPAPVPAPQAPTSTDASEITAQDQIDLINLHNSYRAQHGVSQQVTYNVVIAQQAAIRAQILGGNACQLQHGNLDGVGQNLSEESASYPLDLPMSDLVSGWTGESVDAGLYNHATQMLWATTTEIGCAKAFGSGNGFAYCEVLVCDYFPPGNYVGSSWLTGN